MSWFSWVLAGHVISVIAWMAASLYLPRLFVYHADAETGSVQSETFKIMERRLYRGIMTPAMIASWLFGLWLLIGSGFGQLTSGGWMWVKLLLVIGLSGFHGWMARHMKNFAADANQKTARFFRQINEIPTVIMVLVVIMVIVRPF